MIQNIKDFMTYYFATLGLIMAGAVIYAAVVLNMPVAVIFLYPIPFAACIYIAKLMEKYLIKE